VSRRERKGNGGVNDDAAAAAAAAAASSFTTSFWSNDVSEESRRFSPRRYLSLSFSRWRRGRDFRRERRERERGTEGEKEKERERESERTTREKGVLTAFLGEQDQQQEADFC